MNEEEKLSEVNELSELLIRLRPARGELDSRVVFYDAGFNACQSQALHSRPKFSALIAAALLAVAVTAPVSYRVGRTTATRSRVVQAAPQQQTHTTAMSEAEIESAAVRTRSPEWEPATIVEAAGGNDQPPPERQSLARWIDPFRDLAESTKLERESEATLTAFHSSLASRGDGRDWMEFPYATTLAAYRDALDRSPDDGERGMPPLAASDLQQLTQSMESRR